MESNKREKKLYNINSWGRLREGVKNEYFTVYETQNTFYLIVRGLKNAFSMPLNLIAVTLACEDAYSKLVEVVTIADVDDENRVGNSLLQIWKLRFGQKS